jgi:N-acetyl-anhydromuramyl-L-alanine amidase AmpD
MTTQLLRPTPFKHKRPSQYPLDMIVIHHIGSKAGKIYSARSAVDWFTKPELHVNASTGKVENKVSAHYVIPRGDYEGSDAVIRLAAHEEITYHAGASQWTVNGTRRTSINRYSIGIELEGDGNLVEYTDTQYSRLAEIIKSLMFEYGIREENIVGHEDVSPGRKVDPGKFFDWKRVRQSITDCVPTQEVPETVPDEDFHMNGGEDPEYSFLSVLPPFFKPFIRP